MVRRHCAVAITPGYIVSFGDPCRERYRIYVGMMMVSQHDGAS